jgi:hypothetical protein
MPNNTCDKCRHFNTSDKSSRLHEAGFGSCERSFTDINSVPINTPADRFDPTTAYSWDYESYDSGVYVGPKFGCIHWESLIWPNPFRVYLRSKVFS